MHKFFSIILAAITMANTFAMTEHDAVTLQQAYSDLSQQKKSDVISSKAQELSQRIIDNAENLKKVLSDYQTYDVTSYEIERSVRTLQGLHENNIYLENSNTIDSAAMMLPSNLPLYSLVVFALVPSFLIKSVHVRPNSLLQEHDIISRIYDTLGLDTLFPAVTIVNTDHAGFNKHIREANLVVFTGNPNNAENLIKDMRNNSLLVVNGAGHNPVVVTESANVEQAVEGTLLLKGFNGGQDCAGPDAILVHQDIAKEFIQKFGVRFSALKTGPFTDPETIIGPINRLSELTKFAGIFHKNRRDILSGGVIDFKDNIVSPTTIVRGIDRYPNYEEMFGPVAFIHPYEQDQDLARYFQDPDGRYTANRMYATVYGRSDYISARDDSVNPRNPGNVGIVLQDKTIHDVEIGYKEYGGYSMGASCVIKKTSEGVQKIAMPILIPEVISEYLIKGKNLPFKRTTKGVHETLAPTPSMITNPKKIKPIIGEFQTLAQQVYGDNLVFGFVFGSAAKGKLKIGGIDRDDLDTFICLKQEDKAATAQYIQGLANIHKKYNLKVDETFPAEIMTLQSLESTIQSLGEITISVDQKIAGDTFDRMFWVHALTDKKTGVVGDGGNITRLIKEASPYIKSWRNQIIEQLEKKDMLPDHVCQTFSGLTKKEALAKLSSHSPHLVVHLGLSYDDAK